MTGPQLGAQLRTPGSARPVQHAQTRWPKQSYRAVSRRSFPALLTLAETSVSPGAVLDLKSNVLNMSVEASLKSWLDFGCNSPTLLNTV